MVVIEGMQPAGAVDVVVGALGGSSEDLLDGLAQRQLGEVLPFHLGLKDLDVAEVVAHVLEERLPERLEEP